VWHGLFHAFPSNDSRCDGRKELLYRSSDVDATHSIDAWFSWLDPVLLQPGSRSSVTLHSSKLFSLR
jgi:hypothetical protein